MNIENVYTVAKSYWIIGKGLFLVDWVCLFISVTNTLLKPKFKAVNII